MKIKCRVKDCPSVIDMPNATVNTVYSCRIHSGQDTKNEDLHFQEHQCDRIFDASITPEGTRHISHQGNRAWTAEDISRIRKDA
jgi:hypothetical protein